MRKTLQTAAVVALIGLGNCDTNGAVMASVEGITLLESATTLTLPAGTAGTVALTVVRTGGFPGPVTITATPAGLCAVGPVISPGSTASLICGSLTRGTFGITITASGGSSAELNDTITLTLVVT